MAIQAAIFDCDGTLLDTMDMWRNTTAQLLNSYGLELTNRFSMQLSRSRLCKRVIIFTRTAM